MSLRDRVLGPCAVINITTGEVQLDTHAFLLNLLLFDTYVVESHDLREVPRMVDLLGLSAFTSLLKAHTLRFHPGRMYAGSIERPGQWLNNSESRFSTLFNGDLEPARPGFFEVATGVIGPRPGQQVDEEYLNVVAEVPSLSPKRRRLLRNQLQSSLVPMPLGYGTPSTEQTHADLDRGVDVLRVMVARVLSQSLGTKVAPAAISINVHREGTVTLFAESNLPAMFGLSPKDAHAVLGNALLALGRLNVRIEKMSVCRAVSGTSEGEFPLLDAKLQLIQLEVDPAAQGERFHRIVSIVGLPDFRDALGCGDLDIDRFMEVRASVECAQFREWLRGVDDFSDSEIRERVGSLRARLGDLKRTKPGRALRLATSAGLGFVPVVGPLVGIAMSSLDAFLLDKLLPDAGPVAFLNRLYPSIFSDWGGGVDKTKLKRIDPSPPTR
jgi:hypothetical protein